MFSVFMLVCSSNEGLSVQLVLLKDKKKLFTLDSLGYEPEAAAVHPGGGTVAVGGAVSHQSLRSQASDHKHNNCSLFQSAFKDEIDLWNSVRSTERFFLRSVMKTMLCL